MTTQYESKQEAITMGLAFAGRSDLCIDGKGKMLPLEEILKNTEIKIIDETIKQFDIIREDCTMIEFVNSRNVSVRIASTKYFNGFDLWFIDPKTGASMRA